MKTYCHQKLYLPIGKQVPNLLVLGPSGSGKSQGIMIPLIDSAIASGGATAIINTKGKRMTRIYRRIADCHGRGADVRVVALKDPARSVGWNPIAGVTSRQQADEIAFALVNSSETRLESNDSMFFYNSCIGWLKSAILAVNSGAAVAERSLSYLRYVIEAGLFSEFAAAHPDYPVLAKFARLVAGGSHNHETIGTDLASRTRCVDGEGVQAVLANDELRLENFARDGGILILEFNESDLQEHKPLINLFLQQMFSTLLRTADYSGDGRLAKRTFVFINEFASYGRIPGVHTFLHTIRERGISVIADSQSVSQFGAYAAPDATVLAGFQSQIALPGLDLSSATYFSMKSGVMTVRSCTIGEDFDAELNAGRTVSRSYGEIPRAVLLPSEISRPPMHPIFERMPATFFLGNGVPPFFAYLTPAYEGRLARLMERAEEDMKDQRDEPLTCPAFTLAVRVEPTNNVVGISDTRGWTSEQVRHRLDHLKDTFLEWRQTDGLAKRWFEAFEHENKHRLTLVLRLAEELAIRTPPASINEFFLAYVESTSDNIQANLHYLDYVRLRGGPKKSET